MSCNPDLDTFISEIEWLVKNHSKCILENQERLRVCQNPLTTCKGHSYSMNMTLDIFAKLHQMLHNYIGLLNYRGSKSRSFEGVKIPLVEALDVTVRSMISAMQSCVSKETSHTIVCRDNVPASGCSRCQFVDAEVESEADKLPEIQEVDKKLQRLKVINIESAENVESYIKDILRDITKLPLSIMTSRLETLSSVVRNTKNKLTSCGQPSAASLMGTQVNSISQIVSQFIIEYGQTKSHIFPCKKICRFCGSVICPMDRRRNIFCCENARHLNYLWKEWTRQNSVKGVAKWDEDTIISIVDSFRDTPVERTKGCDRTESYDALGITAGQQDLKVGDLRDGKGSQKINQQGETNVKYKERGNEISSHFSQGENQRVANPLGSRGLRNQDGKSKNKIAGRSGTEKRRDGEDSEEESSFGGNQNRGKAKRHETRLHSSNKSTDGERKITEDSHADKRSNKKQFKEAKSSTSARATRRKDDLSKSEMELNNETDELGVGKRKKGARSGSERGDGGKTEGDRDNKRRGKSQRKKDGELFNESGDHRIRNMDEPGGSETLKKGQDMKNSEKSRTDPQAKDRRIASEKRSGKIVSQDENRAKESGVSERGRTDGKEELRPGKKTREKYGEEADGKHSSGAGREEVKSGNGTQGDSKNIIRYELSNELFVKLGWTLLPKDTTMRRVVEFQALLAKPHMNWLKNNKIHGKQFHADDKTVFINFFEDGSGHVYYPNGQIAIAAHVSKKETHELYKVYGLGGRDVMGMVRLPWLMGVFDSMGNGVVYDENCDVRLTYNQNGGVYANNPTKVPFSWGWNNFQTFPIDEAVYEDPLLDQIPPELLPPREVKISSSKTSKHSKSSKRTNSVMLNAEDEATALDPNHKQKNEKPVTVMLQKILTPLKPICLKMNKHLSLRILDRKNINLQFFAGTKYVRIELGIEINPNVQINSELVDHDNWTAKMTQSRFHLDMNKVGFNQSDTDSSSLIETAEEFRRSKNEAESRQLMIAKYKPQLIS